MNLLNKYIFFNLIKTLIVPALMIQIVYSFAFAQELPIYELEEVVVTVSRTPVRLANANRSIFIISREEILASPADNVQGLLEYALSVDLQTRGPLGVQADVSIRGGSFEQTLILIDGVKINDPQTGHHLLNIPVNVSNIERIEILKGHGSRIYGPNAFGGVINIVTQKPEKHELTINTAAGENGLLMGSITYSHPIGDDIHQITVSEKQSDGYIPHSELKLSSLAYNTSINSFGAEFDVSLGWQDKEFGANTFYSDLYPNEWEHTTVGFLIAGASWKSNSFSYKNSLSFRTHEDDFVLDSERPDWVRNNHSTDVLSFEAQVDYGSNLGITSFGGELGAESIISPSLGDHDRNRGGSFIEHQFNNFGRFSLIGGAFIYGYEGWKTSLYPGVDLGCQINSRVRLFGTIGGSFRVPTYTDLYYDTPANKGNPELQAEEATSLEAGTVITGNGIRTNLSYFMRNGTDIIDWVRADPGDPWQVMNIPELNTSGIEVSVLIHPRWYNQSLPLNRIRLGYTFIESDRTLEALESKYALNYLEHQAKLSLEHQLPLGLSQTWEVRYEERIGYAGYTVVDTRIAMKLSSGSVYVSATNLFDTSYREISSVVMPNRWIKVGWNYHIE